METTSFDTVVSFLKGLGREPVETQDISGFVSNSILMYYAVMALQLVQCGARIETLIKRRKSCGSFPLSSALTVGSPPSWKMSRG